MRVSLLPVMLVFLSVATRASADELSELRDRVMQLEATVEELTLQLADSLRERRQLEARLAETLAAAEAAAAYVAPSATASAAAVTAGASVGAADTSSEEVIKETAVPAEAVTGAEAAGSAAPEPLAAAEPAYSRSAACDVAQALTGYEGKRKGNEALEAWLRTGDHLSRCSTAQLQEIRDAVKWDWLGYEKPVLQLLDKELARR